MFAILSEAKNPGLSLLLVVERRTRQPAIRLSGGLKAPPSTGQQVHRLSQLVQPCRTPLSFHPSAPTSACVRSPIDCSRPVVVGIRERRCCMVAVARAARNDCGVRGGAVRTSSFGAASANGRPRRIRDAVARAKRTTLSVSLASRNEQERKTWVLGGAQDNKSLGPIE